MHLFEEGTPQKLLPKTIIDKLQSLTRYAGDEQTFDAAYVYMFRGLSAVGTHTNIRVLDWYLHDDNGHATFVRAKQKAEPPSSLEDANIHSALLLVSHLSQLVLEARGCPYPAAAEVVQHFLAVQLSNSMLSGDKARLQTKSPTLPLRHAHEVIDDTVAKT